MRCDVLTDPYQPREPRGRLELAQAKRARRQARNQGYRVRALRWVPPWGAYAGLWAALVQTPGRTSYGSRGDTPEAAVRNAIQSCEEWSR